MHLPQSIINTTICFVLALLTSCSSCVEQHDPSKDHALFKQEMKIANQKTATLTEEGKIPESVDATAGGAESKYQTFCASCHGAKGDASGAAAAAMNPKPRDFTDKEWQASVDDAKIAKVIKEGGASVGLSATMAPWGAVLSDSDIDVMVKEIREFGK